MEPDISKQNKTTADEINITKDLALDKIHSQRFFKDIVARVLLEKQISDQSISYIYYYSDINYHFICMKILSSF